MNVRLINDDCINAMQELIRENIKVDLILTDLPYGTTNCKWDTTIPFNEMWDCIHEITYPTTPILLFGDEPFSSNLRMSNIKEYRYDWKWDKIIRTGHLNSKKRPLKQTEDIIVFYRKQPSYYPIMWKGKEENHPHKTKKKTTNVYNSHHETPTILTKMKYPSNIIQVNARSNECNNTKRVHPTQKPIELLEYLIRTYTQEDNIILDFCMGSGSCGVASQNLNRNFIGIELDKEYYEIAKQRISEVQTRLI